MSKGIKLENSNSIELNNIHINVIAQGTRARLARIEEDTNEAEMWEVVDAVEEPYILMKHSNISCVDALFKSNEAGVAELHSYTIGTLPLLRCGNHRFELNIGKRKIHFNCCDIIEVLESAPRVKRKMQGLDIFEIKYNNEIMTIDCTMSNLIKIKIVEINRNGK